MSDQGPTGSLLHYVERSLADFTTLKLGEHRFDNSSISALKEFSQQNEPAVLFIVKIEQHRDIDESFRSSDESFELAFSNTFPATASDLVLAMIKLSGQIDPDTESYSNIYPVTIPNGPTTPGAEGLALIFQFLVWPCFESLVRNSGSSALEESGNRDSLNAIATAKHKFKELERSIMHLTHTLNIEVPDLRLPDCVKGNTPVEVLAEDTETLNSLQRMLNEWKRSISVLVKATRDPSVGTAEDERQFWANMENVLLRLDSMLNEDGVKRTIDILNAGRRFHATVGFPADTGIFEAKENIKQIQVLLRDLPLDLFSKASSFAEIESAINAVFGHISKKLRPSSYPVWRCIKLVELISKSFTESVIEVISSQPSLLEANDDSFNATMSAIQSCQSAWEEQIREFTNLSREVIRKRGERFITIKIKSSQDALLYRLDQIKNSRDAQKKALSGLQHLSEGDILESESLKSMEDDLRHAYEHLISSHHLYDLTKEGEEQWKRTLRSHINAMDSLEAKLAENLQYEMTQATSSSQMFSVLGLYEAFADRPAVSVVVRTYRPQLLNTVRLDIEVLNSRLQSQFYGSDAHKVSSVSLIPSITGYTSWLLQIRSRVEEIVKKIEKILGADWMQYPESQALLQDVEALNHRTDPTPVVKQWCATAAGYIPDFKAPVFISLQTPTQHQPIIQVSVNLDRSSLSIWQDVDALRSMKFQLPFSLISATQECKQLWSMAVKIIECSQLLETLSSAIVQHPQVQLLVQDSLNKVNTLLGDSSDLTWQELLHSQTNDESFFYRFCKEVDLLTARFWPFLQKHEELTKFVNTLSIHECDDGIIVAKTREVLKTLSSMQTTTNYEQYRKLMIDAIIGALCRLSAEFLDHRLDESGMRPFVHKVGVHMNEITIEPSLLVTKASVIEFARETLDKIQVPELLLIDSFYAMPVLSNLLYSYNRASAKAQQTLALMSQKSNLWQLRASNVEDLAGKDIKIWCDLLNSVQDERANLRNSPRDHRFDGLVVLDISPFNLAMETKLETWQNILIDNVISLALNSSSELDRNINEVIESIRGVDFGKISIQKATNFLQILKLARTKYEGFAVECQTLGKCQDILTKIRASLPQNWVYADVLKSDLKSLETYISRCDSNLDHAESRLTSGLENAISDQKQTVMELEIEWRTRKSSFSVASCSSVLEQLGSFKTILEKAETELRALQLACETFNRPDLQNSVESTSLSTLSTMKAELEDLCIVWGFINDVFMTLDVLGTQFIHDIKGSSVLSALRDRLTNLQNAPIRIRQYAAFEEARTKLTQRIEVNSMVTSLVSDHIKERHWNKLLYTLYSNWRSKHSVSQLRLSDLWDINLKDNEPFIQDLISTAHDEYKLEASLDEMTSSWSEMRLEFSLVKGQYQIIRNWKALFSLLDENFLSLHSMRLSPHFSIFKNIITDWENKLNQVRVVFDDWVEVQQQWLYLFEVFSAEQIASVLPFECRKFHEITAELRTIMDLSTGLDKILDITADDRVTNSMRRLRSDLQRLRSSLSEFFEQQRQQFPRLYFLGDDDLLELLGDNSVKSVERHIKQIFPGIAMFSYNESGSVDGISSPEGEHLKLAIIPRFDSILQFLGEIEASVTEALSTELKLSINELQSLFGESQAVGIEWIASHTAQVTVLALRVLRSVLNWEDFKPGFETTLSQLTSTSLAVADVNLRMKLEIIVSELVLLLNDQFDPHTCYSYRLESDSLEVKFFNQEFTYGFEYTGLAPAHIVTPVVQHFFLTMTQALANKQGGAVFGPAGTGKTESVKALGRLVGRPVIVFNCDDTFDFKSLARILTGICQTGFWACFDEFNRLSSQILSSTSAYLSRIESNLHSGNLHLKLDDKVINLSPQTGIFVTMNPTYAGRSALPENLRTLLRQFIFDKPDQGKIVEVILFAKGFTQAEALSCKIIELFSSLRQQLSAQKHYDWGLRSIKSMLRTCGHLLKSSNFSDSTEEIILIKACMLTLLPKLLARDSLLFEQIIKQTFDLESLPELDGDNDVTIELLSKIARTQNLTPSAAWDAKLSQINGLLKISTGVILFGSCASGKSAALGVLKEAQPTPTEVYHIDAKIIKKENLIGSFDATTRDWTDGIFTHCIRRILKNLRGEMNRNHWIIFDCDIDPEWAESLNSVLDDNRLLTLPNGERLAFPENVRLVFETTALDSATPATITRCEMVWFGEEILTTAQLASSLSNWICDKKTASHPSKDHIKWFEELATELQLINFEKLVNTVRDLYHVTDYMVTAAFESLKDYISFTVLSMQHPPGEWAAKKLLWLAVVVANTSSCHCDARTEWANTVGTQMLMMSNTPEGDPLDWFLDPISGLWSNTADSVTNIRLQPHQAMDPAVVVPTAETIRHEKALELSLSVHRPILLAGPPGSGKTMTLLKALKKSDFIDLLTINCSQATTPEYILRVILQQCSLHKTGTGVLTAEPAQLGRWLVVFCDEVNLPVQDAYGSLPFAMMLRQLIERGGFYQGTNWVQFRRVQFVAACNPANNISGRQKLPPRLLRHCSVIYVDRPNKSSLTSIYGTICESIMQLHPSILHVAGKVASSMIQIYFAILNEDCSSQSDIYSPRELTRWCRGIYEYLVNSVDIQLPTLLAVWVYEALRLFCDRLPSETLRSERSKLIWSELQASWPSISLETAEDIISEKLLITQWLSKEFEAKDKFALRSFLKSRLSTFGDEVRGDRLVFLDSFLKHALRVDRVLRQSQGHMILFGTSSSGRSTMVRFVCWLNGLSFVKLKTSKCYTAADFARDLRSVLKRAGGLNEKVCLLIDEANMCDPSILELMNTLLANTEIFGLFESDDLNEILQLSKAQALSEGLNITDKDDLLNRFQNKLVKNFHVIFCLPVPQVSDSAGDNRITQISSALYNRCVVNVVEDWSSATLQEFARSRFETVDLEPGTRSLLVELAASIHATVLTVDPSFTPGEFMRFMNQFVRLILKVRSEQEDLERHYQLGLTSIKSTLLEIQGLRASLAQSKARLEASDKEASILLQQMLDGQTEAERKREAAVKIGYSLSQQMEEVSVRKQAAYQDLEMMQPMLEAALSGVSNIKKQHLNELKSMANPPEAVKATLEGVCLLLNRPHGNWREVLQSVRGENFISAILDFNDEMFQEEIFEIMVEDYFSRPNFTFEAVNRASTACGPLFLWLETQVKYFEVLQRVAPLQTEVDLLEEKANQTKAQELEITRMVAELEQSIEGYKSLYADKVAMSQSIKAEAQAVETKVKRSESLLAGLEQERSRWQSSRQELQEASGTLPGDSLLQAAYITYCGRLEVKSRKDLIASWRQIVDAAGLPIGFKQDGADTMHRLEMDPLLRAAIKEDELAAWVNNELPSDTTTVENLILFENRITVPMLLDSSGKAADYVTTLYPKALKTSFLDQSCLQTIKSALRFGNTLVCDNAEYMDQQLAPILFGDFASKGGRTVIELADDEIDVDKNFQIILLARDDTILKQHHYSSRLDIIDFASTSESLQVFALNTSLEILRPDLAEKKSSLIKLQGKYRQRLIALERALLEQLSENVNTDILENEALMQSLEAVRDETTSIKTDSLNAQGSLREVVLAYESILPIGEHVGRLFKLMESLWHWQYYYRYSLQSIVFILNSVITAADSSITESNVQKLVSDIYQRLYSIVGPSVNFNDRQALHMALRLTSRVSENNTLFHSEEGDFLSLKELLSFDRKDFRPLLCMFDRYDPSLRVLEAVKSFNCQYTIVSLGSKESMNEALALIQDSESDGKFVIIQNLQEDSAFVLKLEAIMRNPNTGVKVPLILTCSVESSALPVTLIQDCTLISVEAPRQIPVYAQELLTIAYGKMSTVVAEHWRVVAVLAWIHSTFQAKLSSVPIGWKDAYKFSDADFSSALDALKLTLQKPDANADLMSDPSTWRELNTLICEAVYIPKINHEEDRKYVRSVFSRCLSQSLCSSNFTLCEDVDLTKLPLNLSFDEIMDWIGTLPLDNALWLDSARVDSSQKKDKAPDRVSEQATDLLKYVS